MSNAPTPIPAVNEIELPFLDSKLTPQGSGAAAWDATKAEAQAEPTTKHPSIDPAYAAEQITALWSKLAPMRAAVLARLSVEEGVEVARCFDSLPRLAFALQFVNAQVALEPTKDLSFKDLVADALGLRERGLVSCDLFEKLGHVPAGTAAAIRKGRGYSDLAEDLQSLHQVLDPHTARLAAIQALATANTTAISEADAARLSHVGTVLQKRLVQPDAAGPWYTSLIGLIVLTARAYDTAISAVQYHLKRLRPTDPQTIPTFFSLRRPRTPKPASPAPTTNPPTAPTT